MAKAKIQDVQSLRFVFIMFVFCFHVSPDLSPLGACGVCFFFVLSGFILSWAYGGKVETNNFSTIKFVIHQLLKIYPLYVIMQIIMTMYFQYSGLNNVSVSDFLVNLFLLQSWFPTSVRPFIINAPTWFLCDIFFCYFCFKPIFNFVIRSNAKKLTIISTILLTAYILVVFLMPESNVGDLYYFPLFRVVDFSLGVVLYRFYTSEKGKKLSKRLLSLSITKDNAACFAFLVVLLIMFYFYSLNQNYTNRYAIFFWPYLTTLIFWFVCFDHRDDIPVIRMLHKRWFMYLGSISMEIYIIHQFVITVVYVFSLHTMTLERTVCVKLCEKVVILSITLLLSMLANFLLKRWTKWVRNRCPAFFN